MPKAKANDITLEYELRGGGDPLVMINGYRRSRQAWGEAFVEALAERFRLVLFDNRGTGGSDKPESGYSIDGFADDTAGLMDALGLERAHVFGVSMGGMIAQRFALRHPERLRALGLGCTHFGGKRIARPEEAHWALLQLKPGPELSPRQVARRQEPVYFHPSFVQSQRAFIEAFYDRMEPYTPPVYVMQAHLAAIEAFDGYDQLPEIAAPTLVITGDSDRLIVPENSRMIAARIPGAKLVLLPQANHLFWLEKPREAANAVIAFMSEVD
jgi:pimeloyl-ACP methyl ester carboxylesterase